MCSRYIFRPIFCVICVALFAAGIAGIVLEETHHSGLMYVRCPQCTGVRTAVVCVASFVALMGLLGVKAVFMRSRITMIFFRIGVFLLFLLSLAYLVLVVLLRTGVFDIALKEGWSASASNAPAVICDFQGLFNCNGWESISCTSNQQTTAAPSAPNNATTSQHRRAAAALSSATPSPSAVCTPSCPNAASIAAFTTTCKSATQNDIDSHFKWLIIGGAILVGFCVFLNFTAFCVKRSFAYFDESDDEPSDDGKELVRMKRYRSMN